MLDTKIINTTAAPSAVGTYSQGVFSAGVYYFSGQIGLSPETMILEDGTKNQLTQILKNIDGLLASEKLTRKNIIKTTIFLTDLNDFGLINEAYEAYFTAPYPARSCVEVSALPKGSLVEIEVIAAP